MSEFDIVIFYNKIINNQRSFYEKSTTTYCVRGRSGFSLTNKKNRTQRFSFFINGTPKRIRIAVYTVKGCCPRPLDDGGLVTKSILY